LRQQETATSHLEAAEILLENGKWPQAQALAVYDLHGYWGGLHIWR